MNSCTSTVYRTDAYISFQVLRYQLVLTYLVACVKNVLVHACLDVTPSWWLFQLVIN